MEFNKKIKIIFVLVFLAGMSIGFGIGAVMQYDAIESYLIERAAAEDPVQIGEGTYTLTPYNTTNLTFINLNLSKEGVHVRKN